MKKINLDNYESYLLDFSEGNLSDELQIELELFLIQHSELDINLSDLSLISLNEESISFSNKNGLKKAETDLVSEEQLVAYIEGRLNVKEKTEIEKSCSNNPLLAKELALFQKTILEVDSLIGYPNKNELKRKPKVIWFNFSSIQYAAAACVLFLIGLFILWSKDQVNNNSSLAINSNNNTKQPVANKNQASFTKQQLSNSIVKESVSSLKKLNTANIKSQQINPENTNTLFVNKSVQDNSNKDSIIKLPVEQKVNQSNERSMAINTPIGVKKQNNTVVQVISENEDDHHVSNNDKNKKRIWTTVSRALKNLNRAGVKSVNGEEKEQSSYAITLGGLSITHKSGL